MFSRPVVAVCALTAGDFVLWNWSLSAHHTVLALVSGLTLPPLAAASVLLLVLTAARLASRLSLLTVRPATARRTAARRRLRVSSARPLGARRARPPEPGIPLEAANGRPPAVADRARRDDPDRSASPVSGRPGKPARKIAA